MSEAGVTIAGSAIGATITVIGTLIIFFAQEKLRKRAKRKEVIQNAIDELIYNKAMVLSARKSVEKAIEQLSVGQTNLYFTHSSKSIASISIMAAYSDGILLRILTPQLFARLNQNVLVFFGDTSSPIETYISTRINEFAQGTYTPQDLYGTFTWIKDKADEAIGDIDKTIRALRKKKVR